MPEGIEEQQDTEQTVKPEEDIAQLRSQLEQLQSERQKFEENWKNEQRVNAKKQQEIEKLNQQAFNITSLEEKFKVLAAIVAEKDGQNEDEFDTKVKSSKPDLLKKFDEIEQGRKLQEQANRLRDRTLAAGITEGDDAYWEIKDLVEAGKFDRADMKLKKLEATRQQPVEEKKLETSNQQATQLTEAQEEEIARKYMQKKGLLKNDTTLPAGGGGKVFTRQQISNMSVDEYKQNKADIDAAMREGRIK